MKTSHFFWKRERYEITDQVRVGGKEFWLSRRLSAGGRQRFLAFDRRAGPKGSLCVLQRLPQSRDAWQRITVLQRLSQQNAELPQILEFYQQGNDIITIERWIEGHDLRWWIQRMRSTGRQQLGTAEAIRLFRQLAHGLSHLHNSCGLVHADIKPANIIVSNATKRLALIDFGSSWTIERTARRTPGDGRSDHYCAPEILNDALGVNFRADCFSLALTCFEVLTQHLPYDGLGGRAGLPEFASARDSLYVPPSELSPERDTFTPKIWQAVDELFLTSLQLNPDQRPAGRNEWLALWDSAGAAFKVRTPEKTSIWQRLRALFRT